LSVSSSASPTSWLTVAASTATTAWTATPTRVGVFGNVISSSCMVSTSTSAVDLAAAVSVLPGIIGWGTSHVKVCGLIWVHSRCMIRIKTVSFMCILLRCIIRVVVISFIFALFRFYIIIGICSIVGIVMITLGVIVWFSIFLDIFICI
jgi:hypothetical protein